MLAKILNGNEIANKFRTEILSEVKSYIDKGFRKPALVIIQIGHNPGSNVYISQKKKVGEKVGIEVTTLEFPVDISEVEVINKILSLNTDKSIDGIIVQLPIPPNLNQTNILNSISPQKDVDCLTATNFGKLVLGQPTYIPCTPLACIEILKYYNIPIECKNALVIGRSNIVGKPLAMLLLAENATVTIAHSKTQNLINIAQQADLLFTAIGKANYIDEKFVKKDAVVIDVGINSITTIDPKTNQVIHKITGDIDYNSVISKASYITPVPGGVGPVTVTMLLKNTLKAYKENLFA